MLELARGADMLISMCWDTRAAMEAAGENQVMLDTTSAATLAAEAGVRTLVLTHLTAHLDTPAGRGEGVREAEAVFDGEIIFAEELQQLDIARTNTAAATS